MGLSIAKKLRQSLNFRIVTTGSDIVPTGIPREESELPTNRQIRQTQDAANDSGANRLVTKDGMPVFFFAGGPHGRRNGDQEWIKGKLRRIRDRTKRFKLAAEYAKRYKDAHDQEPAEHCKDGKAQFATNSWLLKTTK
jgi:hypothetical protein